MCKFTLKIPAKMCKFTLKIKPITEGKTRPVLDIV